MVRNSKTLPCCNPKSSELLPIVKQVIIDIEKCNHKVVAICTDDYQLNVGLFKSLAGSSNLQTTCPNPADSTGSIFLMFDPVHIVKCIRNNWINQKDTKTTLTFPLSMIISLERYLINSQTLLLRILQIFTSLNNILVLRWFTN